MRVDKGRNQKQRRLTPAEIGYIKRAYEMNVSAIEVAKIFDVSERCIRERYQRLRGYALRPHQLEKGLSAKRRKAPKSKPNLLSAKLMEQLQQPKIKRNEARFYHSDFVPS